MYRTVTLMALRAQLPLADEAAIMRHLEALTISFQPSADGSSCS